MTPAERQKLENNLHLFSEYDKIEILKTLNELDNRSAQKKSQDKFLQFVRTMWPEFISGRHHAKWQKHLKK